MRRILAMIVTAAVLAALLGGVLLNYTVWNMPHDKEVSEFDERLQKILLGDSENTVRSILGTPDAIETQFRLGQEHGFEEAYDRANMSGSERYLVYFRGIDVVFSVGVNENGEVRAKEAGGT